MNRAKELPNMKIYKLIMTIIAGIGLLVGILATAIMSNRAHADFEYLFVRPRMNQFDVFLQPAIWMLCLLGLLLASAGIIGKPRYFWPLYLAVGAVYLYSTCVVMFAERPYAGALRLTFATLWIASPGILFIIEGFLIRYLRKRDGLAVEKSDSA
jgi:hypothetical protein